MQNHGGLNFQDLEQRGLSYSDITDFSVNISSNPLLEGFFSKVDPLRAKFYPDSESSLLKKELKTNLLSYYPLIKEENILPVNGTSQGIYLIGSALIKKNEKVGIIEPTFSQYKKIITLKEASLKTFSLSEKDNFNFNIEKILLFIKEEKLDFLWLCSPNNPTGSYLKKQDYLQIVEHCEKQRTTLIIDEAYIAFVDPKKRYNTFISPYVIILRSMTKDFAIPGLRLGYLIGSKKNIEKIKKWQPEWSLNCVAQELGLACLKEKKRFYPLWEEARSEKIRLKKALNSLGFYVISGEGNYLLIKVPYKEELINFLLEKRIQVRDCQSFGLDNFIRIGMKTISQNTIFIDGVKEYLNDFNTRRE